MYVLGFINGKFSSQDGEVWGAATAATSTGIYSVSSAYTVNKHNKDTKNPLYKGLYFGQVSKVDTKENGTIEIFKPIFKLNLKEKTYCGLRKDDSDKIIGYLKDLNTDEEIMNYLAVNSNSIVQEFMRKIIRKNDYVVCNSTKSKVLEVDYKTKIVTTENGEISIYAVDMLVPGSDSNSKK